jgi:hypothetical protein
MKKAQIVALAFSNAKAQFFGVVYDPTNIANAVSRYWELVAQHDQLYSI